MDGVKTIGLVGGIASGKSVAANLLREMGAVVLDADRFGHAVLADDREIQEAIRKRWGNEVFDPSGVVDRRSIARRVFAPGKAGEADLKFLESWTHPRIRKLLEAGRKSVIDQGATAVVIDAALLFEAGWNDVCDVVAFVDAPRDVRLGRALSRGWSAEQFAAREAAQWPVEKKRQQADSVIANEGSEDDLRRALQAFWAEHVAS